MLGDSNGGMFIYNALRSTLQPEAALHRHRHNMHRHGHGGHGHHDTHTHNGNRYEDQQLCHSSLPVHLATAQEGDLQRLRVSIKWHSSSSASCAFGNTDGQLEVWHVELN